MLSMQYGSGLPGAGNVKCRAGAAGTASGLGGSARAAAAAYREVCTAENALNILAVAFGAFQLGCLLSAGKKDFETFIAF
jgi:hypothetical protein